MYEKRKSVRHPNRTARRGSPVELVLASDGEELPAVRHSGVVAPRVSHVGEPLPPSLPVDRYPEAGFGGVLDGAVGVAGVEAAHHVNKAVEKRRRVVMPGLRQASATGQLPLARVVAEHRDPRAHLVRLGRLHAAQDDHDGDVRFLEGTHVLGERACREHVPGGGGHGAGPGVSDEEVLVGVFVVEDVLQLYRGLRAMVLSRSTTLVTSSSIVENCHKDSIG